MVMCTGDSHYQIIHLVWNSKFCFDYDGLHNSFDVPIQIHPYATPPFHLQHNTFHQNWQFEFAITNAAYHINSPMFVQLR